MAPIRRRPGLVVHGEDRAPTYNHRNESGLPSEDDHLSPPNIVPAVGKQQLVPSVDDGLSGHFDELYFLVDIHAQELHRCTDRLKIHLQQMEVEIHRTLNQVAASEESSKDTATRMQPRLVTCRKCRTLRATMVCYPCNHLCVCFECDMKITKCPICKNIKQSSFMASQSST